MPQKPPSFGNVESGSVVSAPQAPFDPTGLVTGATGLFDDLINFPENFATGAKALWEGGNYEGIEGKPTVGMGEGFLRRAASDVAALPGMALSASPIGIGEKALRLAAEKAGYDLPDWVTPATSGVEKAQQATGAEGMQYASPREEAIANISADVITNLIPLGGGVRAETNARQAFRQASAEGKPHWDATKDALDAIANTEAKLPEPVVEPRVEAPVVDEFDQARAEAWGGDPFADLIPEATGRPLEGATSDSSIGAGVSEPVRVGEAPTAIGESVEASTVEQPLSAAAERIRQANEESIRLTGEPLAPEVIQSLREPAVAARDGALPSAKPAGVPELSSRAGQIKSELSPQKILDFSKEANIPLRVMREYHEGKLTTGGLLDSIVNNEGNKYGESPQIRALAGYLKGVGERLGGLEVPIQKFDPIAHKADVDRYAHITPDKAAGYYESKQDVVRIHGETPKMHVLLHETVHGLTARAVANGRNGNLAGEAGRSYQHLNTLFDATKAHLEQTGNAKHYGLTNLDEMMAEFFSNGQFRRELKNTKLDAMPQSTVGALGRMAVGKIKNMYEAVVNGVRGILNLPEKAETALDALFAAQHKFLGDLRPHDRLIGKERNGVYNAPADEYGAAASAKPSETSRSEPPKIIPSWRRKAAQLVSWKGGDLFAKQKEEAALRGGEGDFLADRAAKLFDKAGFKKLDDAGKDVVRKAMQGDDVALSALEPKMRGAVTDTRSQIAKYQAELASQGIKQNGRDMSNMLYESLASGDYLTRAYGVYEIKPNIVDRIGYALSGAEAKGKPYWRWRQEQKHPEAVANITKFIQDNLIDPASKRPVEAQVEDILNDISDPRGKQTFEVTKEAARNSSILERRSNVPKPIRDFWGEFKDPRLESAFTLSRLAALTAKQGMLNRIFKDNDGKLFFDKEDAPQGFYSKLPENDDYGPLAGKYTRPDVAESLETQLTSMKDTASKTFRDAVLSVAKFGSRAFLVPAKMLKTVVSPMTFMVNNYSNMALMAKTAVQHGMMGKMLGIPETFKALEMNVKDLFGKLTPDEASTLIRHGILRDGAQFGELKKVRSRVEKEVEYDEAGPVERVGRATANAGAKIMSTMTDVYQLSDNAARAQFFYGEMTIQKKLHPEWSRKQLIEYSANVARDEVPTWGRAAPAVKGTSQLLGNFATWSGEVVRSYKNQVQRGASDLLNGATPAQKYYGFAQLVGTATSMSLATYVYPKILSSMFGLSGTDDDKKNSAMTKLVPDYQGGDALNVADVDPKSGKIIYMDATRLDPASPLTTFARREMEAWKKDEGLQKTLANLGDAGYGWLKDQFFTPGPALSAALGIATGENRFGKEIDTEGKQKLAIEAFKPGAVVTAQRIEKMQKRGVNQKVVQAQKAGLPMYEMDSRKQMLYSSYDLKDKAAELKTLFSKSFGREDPSTDAELKERYTDYLSKERDLFRELNDKAEALKTILGPDAAKDIIADTVKEAKLPKSLANGIKNGKFEPSSFGGDGDFLDRKMQSALYNDPQREAEIKKDFANRRKQLSLLRRNYEQLLTD